ESRTTGDREADDEDNNAHIVPQDPQMVSQTAINEATDALNLYVKSARMMMPVGTSSGLPNGIKKIEGEKGERRMRTMMVGTRTVIICLYPSSFYPFTSVLYDIPSLST
ncbi:hypothetical protein PAXRUDRAFT_165030, partial [Paxillus rubicundulus Ve08.2h10]